MKTLLIGIGSPYGFDQLGWLALARLTTQYKQRNDIIFHQSNRGGLDWPDRLEQVTRVIYLDALQSDDKPPGRCLRLGIEDCHALLTPNTLSSHSVNLCDNLKLQSVLYPDIQAIEIWGIVVDPHDNPNDIERLNKYLQLFCTFTEGLLHTPTENPTS